MAYKLGLLTTTKWDDPPSRIRGTIAYLPIYLAATFMVFMLGKYTSFMDPEWVLVIGIITH